MWRFKPGLWSSVLALIACSTFMAAGYWQLDRAEQRRERFRAMNEGMNAAPISLQLPTESVASIAWRKVMLRGRYDHAATVYIDNRVLDGKAGYHVITPLKPEGSGRHVLINRGWVSAGRDRATLPQIPMPSGTVSIEGIVTEPPTRTFELGSVDPTSSVWPNLSLDRFREGRGLRVEPLVLLQTDDLEDRLIRRWMLPDSGAEKNQSYALQWFSFAAVTLVFYGIFAIKRTKR